MWQWRQILVKEIFCLEKPYYVIPLSSASNNITYFILLHCSCPQTTHIFFFSKTAHKTKWQRTKALFYYIDKALHIILFLPAIESSVPECPVYLPTVLLYVLHHVVHWLQSQLLLARQETFPSPSKTAATVVKLPQEHHHDH